MLLSTGDDSMGTDQQASLGDPEAAGVYENGDSYRGNANTHTFDTLPININ